ncbi:hypothetical protein LZ30DRAFT_50028 [Colletotrichum cereale]|nr:hypothetical protein LZ30DRAFT_50028 [Colletotrichum cereale]
MWLRSKVKGQDSPAPSNWPVVAQSPPPRPLVGSSRFASFYLVACRWPAGLVLPLVSFSLPLLHLYLSPLFCFPVTPKRDLLSFFFPSRPSSHPIVGRYSDPPSASDIPPPTFHNPNHCLPAGSSLLFYNTTLDCVNGITGINPLSNSKVVLYQQTSTNKTPPTEYPRWSVTLSPAPQHTAQPSGPSLLLARFDSRPLHSRRLLSRTIPSSRYPCRLKKRPPAWLWWFSVISISEGRRTTTRSTVDLPGENNDCCRIALPRRVVSRLRVIPDGFDIF